MEAKTESILLVEDDLELRHVLTVQFESEGFEVSTARTIKEARWELSKNQPSLLLLDLNLPDGDGLELLRQIREKNDHTPVIILTARDEEGQVVEGLDAGADDYVRKPYSPKILSGRVRALLRRVSTSDDSGNKITIGDLTLNIDSRIAEKSGKELPLTPREFALLHQLAKRPGRTFTRNQLLESVCGDDSEAFDRNIDTIVKRIRSKIEDRPSKPKLLLTVWGVGYRLGSGQ